MGGGGKPLSVLLTARFQMMLASISIESRKVKMGVDVVVLKNPGDEVERNLRIRSKSIARNQRLQSLFPSPKPASPTPPIYPFLHHSIEKFAKG